MKLTIKSLIELLDKLKDNYGDIPVIIEDADTGWLFLLDSKHLILINNKILCIEYSYSDELYEKKVSNE